VDPDLVGNLRPARRGLVLKNSFFSNQEISATHCAERILITSILFADYDKNGLKNGMSEEKERLL
jgi:hypothetical protein